MCLLHRTQQTETLRRLLQAACSPEDDLLLEAIKRGLSYAFIKFVVDGTGGGAVQVL